jgi:uncharacterized membrane protein YozB (DUF420 family)
MGVFLIITLLMCICVGNLAFGEKGVLYGFIFWLIFWVIIVLAIIPVIVRLIVLILMFIGGIIAIFRFADKISGNNFVGGIIPGLLILLISIIESIKQLL